MTALGNWHLLKATTCRCQGQLCQKGAEEPEVNGPCAKWWCLEWPDSPPGMRCPHTRTPPPPSVKREQQDCEREGGGGEEEERRASCPYF